MSSLRLRPALVALAVVAALAPAGCGGGGDQGTAAVEATFGTTATSGADPSTCTAATAAEPGSTTSTPEDTLPAATTTQLGAGWEESPTCPAERWVFGADRVPVLADCAAPPPGEEWWGLEPPDVGGWLETSSDQNEVGPLPEGVVIPSGWFVPEELESWLGNARPCVETYGIPDDLRPWLPARTTGRVYLVSPDVGAWFDVLREGGVPPAPMAEQIFYQLTEPMTDVTYRLAFAEAFLDAWVPPAGCEERVRLYGDPHEQADEYLPWPGAKVLDVYRCGEEARLLHGIGWHLSTPGEHAPYPGWETRFSRHLAYWASAEEYRLAWYAMAYLAPGPAIAESGICE